MSDDTVSGFTDAEGCFSVHVTMNQSIMVGFAFSLTQVDRQPLYACAQALTRYGLSRNTSLRWFFTNDDGVTRFTVAHHESLTRIVQPYFQTHPLNSSKRRDCDLFFAALSVYTDTSRDRHERLNHVVHLMNAMNTRGSQRRTHLTSHVESLRSLARNDAHHRAVTRAVVLRTAKLIAGLDARDHRLRLNDGVVIGLSLGDGCFGCDFDMRAGRRASVIKSFSISLIQTPANRALLLAFARHVGFRWRQRSNGRRWNFVVERSEDVAAVERFFTRHEAELTDVSRQVYATWVEVTRFKAVLRTPAAQRRSADDRYLTTTLKRIYYAHTGKYRRRPYDEVYRRFAADYGLPSCNDAYGG